MKVNPEKLKYCISEWRDTFDYCAWCPLHPHDCKGNYIDEETCVKQIIRWISDADEIMKPQ